MVATVVCETYAAVSEHFEIGANLDRPELFLCPGFFSEALDEQVSRWSVVLERATWALDSDCIIVGERRSQWRHQTIYNKLSFRAVDGPPDIAGMRPSRD